eukprot:Gregarina_sp_Poly_1__6437@NODE_343_length_9409_cov_658_993470_g287_i0_p5_GENE_NODE_343_length_9409_cov_658_993470_g287_i0NODE_343_length_9409_cov_658_993470_g287_i0_p5_ORF_typecomplete_len164_score22_96_NODE_343_length_9409_cov_658_993470_g287_i042374728
MQNPDLNFMALAWCCSAPKPDESQAASKIPKLVMPSDMVMTFFTRLRLQLTSVEEETRLREKELHGISPDEFDLIADKIRGQVEKEIEAIRMSYMRSVLLYEEKRKYPPVANERTWSLLVDGPARQRIKIDADRSSGGRKKSHHKRSTKHTENGSPTEQKTAE